MNREIKFKVWCKENEQFIQFNKMGFSEDGSLWYVQGVDENEEETDLPYFENQNDWELMQYTGLKDRNGVEIYEGDIVQYFRNELAEIIFQNGGVDIRGLSSMDREPLQSRLGFMEVLGNIYENPELLERETERNI